MIKNPLLSWVVKIWELKLNFKIAEFFGLLVDIYNLKKNVSAPTVPTYRYPGCNGHYKYVNESSGFIASPGYDGLTPYEPNLNCSWLIEAPKGQVIHIKFRVGSVCFVFYLSTNGILMQ